MQSFALVTVFLALTFFTPLHLSSFTGSPVPASNEEITLTLYQAIDFKGEKPDFDLFYKGMSGYFELKNSKKLSNKKEILTLIDFRKSANEKRMWVIDLQNKKTLYYSLVAHGRNSGDVYATKFSNVPNSNQSSLGFYVTGHTYIGKHGTSLILHGAEEGINHLAQSRAIVMHGADYVSESYIKKVGRLGRSFGCPAVPMDTYQEIIKDVADGTCLFIYYPDDNYLSKTKFGNTNTLDASIQPNLKGY